jgi:hypothetical protein
VRTDERVTSTAACNRRPSPPNGGCAARLDLLQCSGGNDPASPAPYRSWCGSSPCGWHKPFRGPPGPAAGRTLGRLERFPAPRRPRELLPPRASRAAAIGRLPQALPQRQVMRSSRHLLAYVLRRAGSHVALFDGDFTRCSICPRSSLRNRAQSARRSSDTNSPGGSGWRSGGDPASGAGPNTESPPRCGNRGKSCFCNRRSRARPSKSRRQVDSTVVRAAVGSPEQVTLRRSSERARTLLAARGLRQPR